MSVQKIQQSILVTVTINCRILVGISAQMINIVYNIYNISSCHSCVGFVLSRKHVGK